MHFATFHIFKDEILVLGFQIVINHSRLHIFISQFLNYDSFPIFGHKLYAIFYIKKINELTIISCNKTGAFGFISIIFKNHE